MHQLSSLIQTLLPLPFIFLLIKYFFLPIFKRDDFFAAKGELKKISTSTPILKKLGMNTEDYYYDRSCLYQKRDGETLCKVPLENIIRVKVSHTVVNGRRVWLVRYVGAPYKTERELRILNNYSVFNKDFAGFLAAVRAANPLADVQEMNFFRL